jgi:hypothetical protein
MERLTQSKPAWRTLALIGGGIATCAAAALAAVLALVFAASVVVIALVASALLAVAGMAMRARRRAAMARSTEPGVIEARHVGGHSWVAYGWDESRR